MKPERDKAQLIHELEEIASNVTLPLERRLVDTVLWFHKNKDKMPRDNLGLRMDFIEKSLDIILELIAMMGDRLHQAENRPGKSLYLPRGMKIKGDITKFG